MTTFVTLDDIEAKTSLSSSASSVGAARRFVRDVLTSRHGSEQVVDISELLTSEIVTNAIIHAVSGPVLVVRITRGRVRIEVQDTSPAVPVRQFAGPMASSGRGMAIVDELARDWGVEHVPQGKRVWFELPFTTAPRPFWKRGEAAT
ncbi:MAG: ATP-binding protein [Acidimicrobiales bacterium]